MIKIYKDIEQNSDEWWALKMLKLTGSKATAIANAGKGLDTLVLDLITDAIEGENKDRYESYEMRRGSELEPTAILKYEFENNCKVDKVGFVQNGEFAGCSPDGLVGEVGGVEVKCRNSKLHLGFLRGAKLDSSTLWQIQYNQHITGRKWWDFISYHPNFKKSMHTIRITPDPKSQAAIANGIKIGTQKLKELLKDPAVVYELGGKLEALKTA